MNRIVFLNILRSSLEEEMPLSKVNENIKYYDDYLSSIGDELSQEKEIENIGDPRLIAQTIIDSYKMSDEYRYTGKGKSYQKDSMGDGYERDTRYSEQNDESQQPTNSVWSKVKSGITIGVIIFVVFVVLGFAANVFFKIGIPILLCYILVKVLYELFGK